MKLYCAIGTYGIHQSASRSRTVHFKVIISGSDFIVSSLKLEENTVANHQEIKEVFTAGSKGSYTGQTFLDGL